MRSISEAEAIQLIQLRYWHHVLNEMLKAKQFQIPVHLAFGHEAAAVGVDLAMASDDALCLTHRNIAYNLARAKSIDAVLASYRLDTRCDSPAQMASMNLAVDRTGIVYSSSILGNNLAVGAGIAMNRKLSGKPGVVFVMTGDGAMEEGVFWESLIFARSHRLKMVVVIENNDYSMSSTIEQRRSPIDLSLVAAGLGLGYHSGKGAVLPEVRTALDSARREADGGSPVVVELYLTTFNQHAGPTPGWATDPMRISMEDGLLLGDDPEDPIYQLREALGVVEFNRISEQIMAVS